ncbi:MAG: trimeric intracellular cation channel family protein [Bacteroidales bacterium]|uniref:trimeric intracellular cation channel family protein n=1 Tax=Porphyromonas sp. TaxID=1924944 RepID=UPI002971D226|nr:trimeric intracellular cation channel family protein [Porphyromonas sp.]MDD7438257.1 trimeric intracellular cation channel family protein [Bacteroidales bacterium]MDY3067189.1 trimeric intracellular cation channel family protein [Porphyromonas sp.]
MDQIIAFEWQQLLNEESITLILDYLGTFAFAISGVRLASGENIDLFGAYVIGLLTAVGGGTIRDLLLGLTPFWLTTPSYVLITLISLLIVITFRKQLVKMNEQLFLYDAIGLGFFTIVGMEKAIMVGFPFWVALLMGVITGSFGGLLRDVSINQVPLIFRKDIYAMASVSGGLVFGLLEAFGVQHILVQVISVSVVIATRVLCVKYHISLPVLKATE